MAPFRFAFDPTGEACWRYAVNMHNASGICETLSVRRQPILAAVTNADNQNAVAVDPVQYQMRFVRVNANRRIDFAPFARGPWIGCQKFESFFERKIIGFSLLKTEQVRAFPEDTYEIGVSRFS